MIPFSLTFVFGLFVGNYFVSNEFSIKYIDQIQQEQIKITEQIQHKNNFLEPLCRGFDSNLPSEFFSHELIRQKTELIELFLRIKNNSQSPDKKELDRQKFNNLLKKIDRLEGLKNRQRGLSEETKITNKLIYSENCDEF